MVYKSNKWQMKNSLKGSGKEIHLLVLRGRCPDLWCTPEMHGSPEDGNIGVANSINKLASLKAMLVWNYGPPTHQLTGVKWRATSVAKNLPQHTLCDSHGLCRPACNKKILSQPLYSRYASFKSNEFHFISCFITCSIRLWTIPWEGQRSRAPTLLPRCSSGSWPGCCKPSSRAKAQSGA